MKAQLKDGTVIDGPPGTIKAMMESGKATVINPQRRSERVGAGPKVAKAKQAAKKSAKKAVVAKKKED